MSSGDLFIHWIKIGLRTYRKQLLNWFHRSNILVMNKDSGFLICEHLDTDDSGGDMICVYSLFNNIYDLNYSLFFTLGGAVPTIRISCVSQMPKAMHVQRIIFKLAESIPIDLDTEERHKK